MGWKALYWTIWYEIGFFFVENSDNILFEVFFSLSIFNLHPFPKEWIKCIIWIHQSLQAFYRRVYNARVYASQFFSFVQIIWIIVEN